MVIWLKDGTQQSIFKPEDFHKLIAEKLGDGCGEYVCDLIQQIEDFDNSYCENCGELEDQVDELQGEIGELSDQITKLETELAECSEKLDKAEETIARLEACNG